MIVIKKLYSLLGLAKRAGKIASGETRCKDSIRYGSAFLVILAEDVSKNTCKSITDSCKYYGVPYFTAGTKESLGHAIGNEFNAVIAVTDEGFSNSIEKCINANINGGE